MYNLVIDLIKEHALFLADEVNYTENHNHGIFQDRALIYCAYFLNDSNSAELKKIAQERLASQKDFAFSSEQVHVENSPGYQIGVMDLFRVIGEFLMQFENPFGNELYQDVVVSAEFMAYITKPNGLVAEIGDTNSSVNGSTVTNSKMSIFNNAHLTYASTQGLEGEQPQKSAVFYPNSGYYISHNSWDKVNYSDSTWQMFKSGYSSKTHKHADDNSFMLYSKGHDIFVDTGWYNYMTGDNYRDYFVSSLAHNTVVVDEKTYSATDENSSKVGIYDYIDEELYDYVCGYNEMYDGVSHDRHFYNLGDAIILWDDITSNGKHMYSQLFHASESMKLISVNNTETLFKLADTGYFVRVKQLCSNGNNSVISGNFEDAKYGYVSRQMGYLDTINTLKHDVIGKNVEILTVITIEDGNGKIKDISNIQYDAKNKTFNVLYDSGELAKIELKARTQITADDITVISKDANTFIFQNNNTKEMNSYAWYIIDKHSASVVHKEPYSTNAVFEYEFGTPGEYFVKAYTKSENGRYRCSSIVAVIMYDETTNQYTDVTAEYPYLNLQYNGHKITQIDNYTYNFELDYNYSWNSNVRWYIYKNGGYYANFTTLNKKNMEYTFTEPGSYTVIYYLSTPNGDNEYWNFSALNIN